MSQELRSNHFLDDEGHPEGGSTEATGLLISWQRGPLGRGPERSEPNGCFVETVIEAAVDRIEFYQRTQFACDENAQALKDLRSALSHLRSRTERRENEGVEGTCGVDLDRQCLSDSENTVAIFPPRGFQEFELARRSPYFRYVNAND